MRAIIFRSDQVGGDLLAHDNNVVETCWASLKPEIAFVWPDSIKEEVVLKGVFLVWVCERRRKKGRAGWKGASCFMYWWMSVWVAVSGDDQELV